MHHIVRLVVRAGNRHAVVVRRSSLVVVGHNLEEHRHTVVVAADIPDVGHILDCIDLGMGKAAVGHSWVGIGCMGPT